jgi:hypothetical protein
MKAPIFLIISLLVFIGACGYGGRDISRIIAKVGESKISCKDVSCRTAIEEAYGNKTVTDVVTLVALVNDVIECEVGRMCGVTATTNDLSALSRHADKTSKAPAILAEVKKACSGNSAVYERLYLAPRIINQKLRAWYSRSSNIHDRERALIEKAYALVRTGKRLEEAALDCGLSYSSMKHEKRGRVTPDLLKQYFPEGEELTKDPLTSILETLSENEVYRNIVEDDRAYKVIRLLEKSGSKYKIESITAPKRSFDEWFREMAAQVGIEVLDMNLKKKIARQYSNIWWVKELPAR